MEAGLRSIAPIALAALLTSCAHAKIPQTNIDDTEENRNILSLVDEYQRAVQSLDAEAVIALVSPRFYENNGNRDEGDDYDLAGLRTLLVNNFSRTRAMQLNLRVDAIDVIDDKAFAELYYTYRAHNEYPSGMKWDTGTDRTRLQLERSPEGRWLIISGI